MEIIARFIPNRLVVCIIALLIILVIGTIVIIGPSYLTSILSPTDPPPLLVSSEPNIPKVPDQPGSGRGEKTIPAALNEMPVEDEDMHIVDFIPPEVVEIRDQAYSIGKYEITNRQYRCFVKATGHSAPSYWEDPNFCDDQKPVVGVGWDEARVYCAWLTKKAREKGDSNVRYDLPTKEQWDVAAGYRKECGPSFPWENSLDEQLKEHANIGRKYGSPLRIDRPLPHTTDYAVVDMPGNVAEWCLDPYTDETRRIVRGGWWASDYSYAKYLNELDYPPEERKESVGFRVVAVRNE